LLGRANGRSWLPTIWNLGMSVEGLARGRSCESPGSTIHPGSSGWFVW
jgi:hypothetical protein